MASVLKTPTRFAVDIFKKRPEGTLCEVVENTLYMATSRSLIHQKLSGELCRIIANHVVENDLGELNAAPMDVYLDDTNAYQPDIVFVLKENEEILHQEGIVGTPDLIIEILSPRNKNHDLVKKKAVYEKCGVKEFFAVDPKTKHQQCFELKMRNTNCF